MAEYTPSFGLVFAIDAITLPADNSNYYYFCTVCLYPPADYYRSGKVDLSFIYKVDLAVSLTQSLLLQDDPLAYSLTYDRKTVLIIELNRVLLDKNALPAA
jgi:hypothetical protein